MSLPDGEEAKMVLPSNLVIHETKPLDMSIQTTTEACYRPNTNYNTGDGDIRFKVPGNEEEYFNPALTYLEFGLQVTGVGNAALADGTVFGIINQAAQAAFQTVTVILGNQMVSQDHYYPYRAYLAALTGYTQEALESHQAMALWHKDTAERMDLHVNVANNGGNTGMIQRSTKFAQSAIIPCRIHLECDLFSLDKFIPNLVDLEIILTRSRAQFMIMAPEPGAAAQDEREFHIHIHDPVLWVTKIKPFPTIAMMHVELTSRKPVRYDLPRMVIRPIPLPFNTTVGNLDNVTSGKLPKRIWYAFVRSDAFDGHYNYNPFNFQHLGLLQTSINVNGTSYPANPLKVTYTGNNANWTRAYSALFSALNIYHGNRGIPIKISEFPHGFCIYGFDITPNHRAAASSIKTLDKQGTIRIDYHLSAAPGNVPFHCIVWAEYNNVLEIDENKNVFVNYPM